jgi:hypothetical protein
MKRIPKYSASDVEFFLNSPAGLPDNITEDVYEKELRDNDRLKWKINPFLSKKCILRLLLDNGEYKRWTFLKRLNWLIVICIIVFSYVMHDARLLWMLLVFRLFMNSGLLDHWIMVSMGAVAILLKMLLAFDNMYCWFTLSVAFATFLLSKVAQEFLEKTIIRKAFVDGDTFWKFYSNKLIYIDTTVLNNEFQHIFNKYPELNN